MTTAAIQADLKALKRALQNIDPGKFERLVAALVGDIIGVGVVIAKSGFQHGGDGGTAGRQGRRLRIETKRYADSSTLNERELLGELEQAIQRDSALELWVLAATRETKEQLETSLFESGLKQGVPVLIVDWKADGYPRLAALCAGAPNVVTEIAGASAGIHAQRLAPSAASAIERLRRELSSWQPGYESVRRSARDWLLRVWNSPAEAVATFGQDAAGGADSSFIQREHVVSQLDAWRDDSVPDPAMVVGEDGMGKTWATLGWFAGNADNLPIPLVVPSGALPTRPRVSAAEVKALLGARLHEVTGVRDQSFWTARIDKMLERPEAEGPTFMLLLDGMNQSYEAPWVSLHQQFQAGRFAGRVRILSSTRPLFLDTHLRNMAGLIYPPKRVDIGPYDLSPGGEFDMMLACRNLKRKDIREDLVPHASVPRLFDLVIRLRDRLQGIGRITVHRLLWEYGRDSLGIRGERAFSESEWREWLASIASKIRETGRARFSRGEVETITARPTLNPSDVLARLSDIVDSPISDRDPEGGIVLRPETVAHALGAAILAHLSDEERTPEEASAELDGWLGPISGLSERGEILRAAVAILCASPDAAPTFVGDTIVSAWLSTQNLPDGHRSDVLALAPDIAAALLFAVETITSNALATARDLAIDGLRSIPRSNEKVRGLVKEATTRWMRVVSRGLAEVRGSDEFERARSNRMIDRTGSDADGPRTIFGLDLRFVAQTDGSAFTQIPDLLEGYPLAGFMDLFELAALHLAIRGRLDVWASLEWLALWNQIDFAETAVALRAKAEEFLTRRAEPGVEPRLARRVAALLLWLSRDPAAELRARDLDPRLDSLRLYEEYEADPSSNMFALERRHAEQVLDNASIPAMARARRLEKLWWDPTLAVSGQAAADMIAASEAFATQRLGVGPHQVGDDLALEQLGPALARCSPPALGRLTRQRILALASMEQAPADLGDAAYDTLLIGDDETAVALRSAQERLRGASETDVDGGTRQLLLQADLIDMDSEEQVDAILAADLPCLFTNVAPFLKRLDAAASDRLVARHRDDSQEATDRLVGILSLAASGLGPVATEWLEQVADDDTRASQIGAYQTLSRCCAARFGDRLMASDWAWRPGHDLLSHYGSRALVAATLNVPFELVAPRIAPWLVANAVKVRDGGPAEARLAAEILDRVVRVPMLDAPDPASQITIDLVARDTDPFSISLTSSPPASGDSPIEELNALMDQGLRDQAAQQAVAIAAERIRTAREGGASLYLASLDSRDLEPLLIHAGAVVDAWLEGLQEKSADFRRRVRLAEGFFVALTEAMLQADLERGLALWTGVKANLETRFISTAGIDKLVMLLLRAPDKAQVTDLVHDLVAPRVSHNDDVLLDISVAAAAAGREGLLATIAAEDRASGVRWRMERAKALEGFAPGEGANAIFPDGRQTPSEFSEARWGERRYRDHCAKHWWDIYWNASNGEDAFAAWTLLSGCVDRRAIEWMSRYWPGSDANFPLIERKHAFAAGRWEDIKRAAKSADDKQKRTLFGRDLVKNVGPWTPRHDVDAAVIAA